MMDSYELSKIGGAVCAALLLIFVPKTLIDMRQAHGEKPGYMLPEPAAEVAAAPAAPAAAPAADGPSAVAMLASASADNGKSAFGKCAACHSAQKGGANGLGPNLWNIVGRKIGGVSGFGYSEALKKKGAENAVWDLEKLAAWLQADDKVIPGNKMIFPGIADKAIQADVLAYLRSLSDSPAALPK